MKHGRSIFRYVGQSRRTVPALCMVCFAVSAVIGLHAGETLRYPDERDYRQLAISLAEGEGYTDAQGRPTAYRPPGYPWLLSHLYRIWPSPLAAKFANALALAGTGWLLAIIAGSVAPEGRVFAPVLLLSQPVFCYTAGTLYPQTVGTLLWVVVVLGIIRRPRTLAGNAALGCVFGALILTIPFFVFFLPLACVFLVACRRVHFQQGWAGASLFLTCAVLTVAPWSIRNAGVFNTFVPVSANSGINLLLGNSENTRPDSGVNVDIASYRQRTENMGEAERDRFYRQAALAWIARNPARAMRLYIGKVAHFFAFREQRYVRSETSRVKDAILFFTYYPLLALALIRLALRRKFPLDTREIILYIFYFSSALPAAVFFTRIRFRIPMDALLIAMVAIFLGKLVRNRQFQPASAEGLAAT